MMRYRHPCRQIFRRNFGFLGLLLLCVSLSAFTLFIRTEWMKEPVHLTERRKRFLLDESDIKEYHLKSTSEEELGTIFIPYRGKTARKGRMNSGRKPSTRIGPTEPRRIVFFSYGDDLSSKLTDFFAVHPDVFLMRGTFANENNFETSLGGCTAAALGKLTSPRVDRCRKRRTCHSPSTENLVKKCRERPYQMFQITASDMTKKFDWVPIVCKLTKSDENLVVVHLMAEPLDIVYNRLVHQLTLARRDELNNNDTASALDEGKKLCIRIRGDLSSLHKAGCSGEKIKSFSVKNIILNLPDSWLELHNYIGTYVDDRTNDLLQENSIAETLKARLHRMHSTRHHLFPETFVKHLNEACGGIEI
ncbi:uncharacterized protein LOC135486910 isoform X2 [Lineus longissimus]